MAVVRYTGEPRYFQLSALRGRFESGRAAGLGDPGRDARAFRGRAGVQHGRGAGRGAVAVRPRAGRPAEPDRAVPGCRSPRPRLPERFTSDGPRRMFFPAPVSAPEAGHHRGGRRQDVGDGLRAVLRHLGRRAARGGDRRARAVGQPGATEADIREAFDATALDLAPAGVDSRTGRGLLRADSVLAYTGATPQPLVRGAAPT